MLKKEKQWKTRCGHDAVIIKKPQGFRSGYIAVGSYHPLYGVVAWKQPSVTLLGVPEGVMEFRVKRPFPSWWLGFSSDKKESVGQVMVLCEELAAAIAQVD